MRVNVYLLYFRLTSIVLQTQWCITPVLMPLLGACGYTEASADLGDQPHTC